MDKVKRVHFTTTLDEELLQKTRIQCIIDKESVNRIFEDAMREYLKNKEGHKAYE